MTWRGALSRRLTHITPGCLLNWHWRESVTTPLAGVTTSFSIVLPAFSSAYLLSAESLKLGDHTPVSTENHADQAQFADKAYRSRGNAGYASHRAAAPSGWKGLSWRQRFSG